MCYDLLEIEEIVQYYETPIAIILFKHHNCVDAGFSKLSCYKCINKIDLVKLNSIYSFSIFSVNAA